MRDLRAALRDKGQDLIFGMVRLRLSPKDNPAGNRHWNDMIDMPL